METKTKSEFDQLYAHIKASSAKMVYIKGEYQHLFTPPPKDGRAYVVYDKSNPDVYHMTDKDGRYKCLDLSDARFRVQVSTSVRKFTAESYAKHQEAMRQQVKHPNHPQRRKKTQRTWDAKNFAQGNSPVRLIQLKQVISITGFGKTFIYDSIECSHFPKPVKLGSSRRAAARWVEAEVHAWIETLMTNRATSAFSTSKI